MTLADIEKIPKEILVATDIAPYLGADPGVIRWQARNEPDKLGFPVIVAKSRVKVPKVGFITFCKRGKPIFNNPEGDTECQK